MKNCLKAIAEWFLGERRAAMWFGHRTSVIMGPPFTHFEWRGKNFYYVAQGRQWKWMTDKEWREFVDNY